MAHLIDVTMDFARASLGGGIPVDRNPVSDLKDRFERVIDEIRLAHPGREITLELTQDCLADVLRASERKISVEEIQRKVAEHYNIRMSDLIGPKRVRSYARPRQVAMYLAKSLTARSLPEIGRRFGGRDHTTVIHGVRRIEELKSQDGQIAEDVEMLRRALEA